METIAIGDACEVLNGYAFKSEKYTSSGIRIIRIANVQKGYIEDNSPVFYPIDSDGLDKYMLRENDLLVSLTGNVGRTALLTKDMLPAALNQRVACLRLKTNKITNGFLFHLLNSNYFESKCIQSSQGVAQKNMSTEWLKSYELPLYSLSKQNEITKILDDVRNTIILKEQELQKFDELIKARFVEMFGSVHDSVYYSYLPVGNFTKVISGGTPNRKKDEYWKRGNIPWIKTTELQNDVIKKTEECITEVGLKESSAKIVPIGTVLVAMYGQGKTRGKTAYLDIEACTNQACACILPSQNVNSKYLWKYFELSYEKLRSLAQGAGQPNLNGNMIKDFPVLIPPINMQNDYVSFVEQVDKSKLAVQQSLEKTQLLFDSLMQEYFGEN